MIFNSLYDINRLWDFDIVRIRFFQLLILWFLFCSSAFAQAEIKRVAVLEFRGVAIPQKNGGQSNQVWNYARPRRKGRRNI